MEPKVNYILVGSFIAILGAAVLIGLLWLGKTDYRGIYDRYEAYFRESVAGLSVDSTVKYRGVDVGRVKSITLNPDNPEEVKLTLDIASGTPVKTDTIAVLQTQGLTGLATINLMGGSREAPRLEVSEGQVYPVIKTGPSFVEMFVGVGAARVRDLFDQAKLKAPCIIFIDELDALGKARGAGPMGHEEREQTLNQLLVEMDGFDPRIGVILMAATNRPEILDPALLRAGRFDRHVVVDRPDKIGRLAILRVHAKQVALGPDADLETIAAMTPGFSGADLANIINEAALLAVRRGKDQVGVSELQEAVERVIAGLEKKNRVLNKMEKERVAYHETGHALVAMSLPGMDQVQKISIIPRGVAALGYTLQLPTEDRFLMTKSELENKVAVLLGGRIAEELTFGEASTGAQNDLVKATDIAKSMVKAYGMSDKLGTITLERERQPQFLQLPIGSERGDYSEETAREIDCEVRRIIDEQYERVKRLLAERKAALQQGAQLLLEQEVITGIELKAIMEKV
ncbi:MAG: ATP-dependent zinc metalloprotease FtsH [Nitrospira sp.]|nr:ATP-dependent zinc metalloprotease FtsH [Nitrospira sp.]